MRTRFLCLVIAVAAAACGGDDSISINDLAKKFIAAQCANQVTCQQMPDTATCEASFAFNDNAFMTLVADVNAKIIKYDGTAAASCANEISSATCSFTGFFSKANDPCGKMFTGTVAAGGACFISEECSGVGSSCNQTDPNCDSTTTCCPGTCAAAPAKMPVNGHCTSTSDCNDGLYCSTTTSVCKTPLTQSGAACDELDGCANPMYCNGSFATMPFTGVCTTAPATGATCNPMDLLPCTDERDYCDTGTKKCTRSVSVGGTCDSAGTGTGATCVGYADCTTNSCVARPKAGATCMTSGSSCLGSLSCTNGTCQLPAAGMACK